MNSERSVVEVMSALHVLVHAIWGQGTSQLGISASPSSRRSRESKESEPIPAGASHFAHGGAQREIRLRLILKTVLQNLNNYRAVLKTGR
jgi:hypothetical protein